MCTDVYFVYMHTCSDINNLVRSTGGFSSHEKYILQQHNTTYVFSLPCGYHLNETLHNTGGNIDARTNYISQQSSCELQRAEGR